MRSSAVRKSERDVEALAAKLDAAKHDADRLKAEAEQSELRRGEIGAIDAAEYVGEIDGCSRA